MQIRFALLHGTIQFSGSVSAPQTTTTPAYVEALLCDSTVRSYAIHFVAIVISNMDPMENGPGSVFPREYGHRLRIWTLIFPIEYGTHINWARIHIISESISYMCHRLFDRGPYYICVIENGPLCFVNIIYS